MMQPARRIRRLRMEIRLRCSITPRAQPHKVRREKIPDVWIHPQRSDKSAGVFDARLHAFERMGTAITASKPVGWGREERTVRARAIERERHHVEACERTFV